MTYTGYWKLNGNTKDCSSVGQGLTAVGSPTVVAGLGTGSSYSITNTTNPSTNYFTLGTYAAQKTQYRSMVFVYKWVAGGLRYGQLGLSLYGAASPYETLLGQEMDSTTGYISTTNGSANASGAKATRSGNWTPGTITGKKVYFGFCGGSSDNTCVLMGNFNQVVASSSNEYRAPQTYSATLLTKIGAYAQSGNWGFTGVMGNIIVDDQPWTKTKMKQMQSFLAGHF